MSRVKILPDILSNKIAAGEVVERPASVVKELLENALDAGGTRIVIDVEKGGRSLLKVSDNGSGMQRDDALLSIERYATSKVYTDQDLFAIQSLGFRGEALPSIASVSRFSLMTRVAESDTGTQINIEGGKIKTVNEISAPCGTTVIVRDLFFNVPARRKFLKTIATEMSHIADTVTRMALGWPAVHFRLLHNGRLLKSWAATDQPVERIMDILGGDLARHLHAVRLQDAVVDVAGWIAAPEVWRTSARRVFIFVNGRSVKNRNIQQAVFEGFRGRLIKGRYPVAVLFLKVPFDRLDVNVHPTKHEVRFADQQCIYAALREHVAQTLQQADRPKWQAFSEQSNNATRADTISSADGEAAGSSLIPEAVSSAEMSEKIAFDASDNAGSVLNTQNVSSLQEQHREADRLPKSDAFPPAQPSVKPLKQVKDALRDYQPVRSFEDTSSESLPLTRSSFRPAAPHNGTPNELWKPAFFSELTVIGQLHDTYILCESREGLILIDQHAAHERVVYEDLKCKSEKDSGCSQQLLIPETIELGYREADGLLKILPELNRVGLQVEPFGGQTFAVKAVPALIDSRRAEPLVRQIADRMVHSGDTFRAEEVLEECLMLMACHGAIRARQPLSSQQMTALLRQLDNCDNSSHCPHGRPLWIQWTTAALEKAFARIV